MMGSAETFCINKMAAFYPSESKKTRFYTDFDGDQIFKDIKEFLELTPGIT